MQKQKEAKTFKRIFYLIFFTRFCESQNLSFYKVDGYFALLVNPADCHADSANLLAMTKKGADSAIRRISIEVMAVEVLYL